MSEFTKPSYNIPAFGGWNYGDDFPITQRFHSARAAGFLRYTAGGEHDLYRCSDDLDCDQGNKAAITVISSTKKEKSWTYDKVQHWTSGGQQVGQVGQVAAFPRPPKAVDEDLYKISPHQLQYSTSTRKKMLSLFSRCLEPSCHE